MEGAPKRFGVPFVSFELSLLSFGSGCMDILSYRELGQVFTSAMTGNTALLGLGLGQGDLASASRNLSALLGFIAGLVAGSTLLRRHGGGWSNSVTATMAVELGLLLMFSGLWIWAGGPMLEPTRYVLIAVSAVAMGIQSAAAHAIGMPGITTTYFTGTMTNIIARAVGRTLPGEREQRTPQKRLRWPLAACAAYVAGAGATGYLTIKASILPPITLTALPALTVGLVVLAGIVASWQR